MHDGPPYANGEIHIGHALNKVLKDTIVRYKNLNGFYTPFIPGFDTHGMPTEKKAIEKLGLKREEIPADKFDQNESRQYTLSVVSSLGGFDAEVSKTVLYDNDLLFYDDASNKYELNFSEIVLNFVCHIQKYCDMIIAI